MAPRSIGLIGLGLLGSAIAERLVGSGYSVRGFDIDESRRANLDALGGSPERSAEEVARKCDSLLLSLPDSGVVASVLARIDSALRTGSTIMDTTTGAPEDAVAFGEALARNGRHYLDTTVGGSSDQVRRHEAIVIAGGNEAALARCLPVLQCFGRKVFHTGPCGSGASMKLVVNLVLGLNRAALAEGLAFATGSGLARQQALEILKAGPAYSKAIDRKGHKMLSGDFEPEARLSQHLKDVRLILASGRRNGVRLPLSQQHAALLERAEALGFGSADNSAVIKAFE